MDTQTLFIPESIHIELFMENNQPLRQENILIGINTYANYNYRNDIQISPLLTNSEGRITISAKQIKSMVSDFISFGLMDYVNIEYAKPNVEIFVWGNKSIDIYWGLDIDPRLAESLKYTPGLNIDDIKRHLISQRKQVPDYQLYEDCFNRTMNLAENLVIANGVWDHPQQEVFYKAKVEA